MTIIYVTHESATRCWKVQHRGLRPPSVHPCTSAARGRPWRFIGPGKPGLHVWPNVGMAGMLLDIHRIGLWMEIFMATVESWDFMGDSRCRRYLSPEMCSGEAYGRLAGKCWDGSTSVFETPKWTVWYGLICFDSLACYKNNVYITLYIYIYTHIMTIYVY